MTILYGIDAIHGLIPSSVNFMICEFKCHQVNKRGHTVYATVFACPSFLLGGGCRKCGFHLAEASLCMVWVAVL